MVEWVERVTALIATGPGESAGALVLPAMGRFTERDGLLLARVAPHQVLAMREGVAGGLVDELAPLVGEAGLIDLSDARVAVRVRGVGLEKLLPLDLSVMAVGCCAGTLMAHLNVLVLRLADDLFELQCGRSFAGSFARAIDAVG